MKKIITGVAITFVISITVTKAQTVCAVKNTADADVVVYVVQDSSTADLIVYKDTSSSGVGANNGVLYFTAFADQAQKKICFVSNPANAQLNIYFTTNSSGAAWLNSSKESLMN